MRWLIFILLLLPAWCFGQSVTPQWRSDAFGMGYTYVGLGHQDTMWNAAKIRSYTGSAYTANNGITKTGNNFALGGTLSSNTVINMPDHTLFLFGTDSGGGLFTNYLLGNAQYQLQSGDNTGYISEIKGQASSITISSINTASNAVNLFMSSNPSDPNSIVFTDNVKHVGIKHNATGINHATWDNNTYVDKKYADSVASIGGVSPDSVLHPNKNLYDLPNKATSRINIGLNGTHTPGYGLSGSNYNATANQTWGVDTTSTPHGLVDKARATANYVYLFGAYSNPIWITALAWSKITGTPTTLSGYGLSTDFNTIGDARYLRLAGGTLTGDVLFSSDNTRTIGSAAAAASRYYGYIFSSAGQATFAAGGIGSMLLNTGGSTRISITSAGVVNIANLTASKPVFTDASKNLTSTGPGTGTQSVMADGSISTLVDNVLNKTGNYTILATDFAAGKTNILRVWVDATAGNVTITLPSAASSAGYSIYVTKTDASVNTVSITPVLTTSTLVLQGDSKNFAANSSTWYNQ